MSAIIWIQSRFCQFDQNVFDKAVLKLTLNGIKDLDWNLFASPECCGRQSSSATSTISAE